MNSGLRDANNLAWKLAAVARGALGPGLLASYQRERRDHAAAMIGFALNMGRVLAPPNAAAAWLIEQGFRALSLFPRARDYIAQMKFKPPPRFAEGFIVPDGRSARRTPVGRLFPQPRVRGPDGQDGLLDEWLGPGFSAVLYDGDAASIGALSAQEWPGLDVTRVALLPPGVALATPAGVTVVTQDAPDPRLAQFRGHVFLLRPDRYVAACLAPNGWPRGIAAVGALVDATFKSAPIR
jgi:3-(3-hydroxy-phenyl)propionate hydroxylase